MKEPSIRIVAKFERFTRTLERASWILSRLNDAAMRRETPIYFELFVQRRDRRLQELDALDRQDQKGYLFVIGH
jgi:hypothetical protein